MAQKFALKRYALGNFPSFYVVERKAVLISRLINRLQKEILGVSLSNFLGTLATENDHVEGRAVLGLDQIWEVLHLEAFDIRADPLRTEFMFQAFVLLLFHVRCVERVAARGVDPPHFVLVRFRHVQLVEHNAEELVDGPVFRQ